MKKIILTAAIAATVATPAFATEWREMFNTMNTNVHIFADGQIIADFGQSANGGAGVTIANVEYASSANSADVAGHHARNTVDLIRETAGNATIFNADTRGQAGNGRDGVNFTADQQQVDILNFEIQPGLSGGLEFDHLRQVRDTWSGQMTSALAVVAAGNFGSRDGQTGIATDVGGTARGFAPLNADDMKRVIYVGALDGHSNTLASYSNTAGGVKDHFIVASDVFSAARGGRAGGGTSSATPKVTGAAALVMAKFGTNAENTKKIILQTADDLGAPGVDAVYGHGKLNVVKALNAPRYLVGNDEARSMNGLFGITRY